MNLRSIGTCVTGTAVLLISAIVTDAQVARRTSSSSASHVAAEMTKGKLSPGESKPGDTVAVKLIGDVKSNGAVVLKKGTTITGVVRNVRHAADGVDSGTQAQSMIEVEWLAPVPQGKTVRNLSIALQSVTQRNPVHMHNDEAPAEFGLASSAEAAGSTSNPIPSNPALLNMPSVVAVDHSTSSVLESSLGAPSGRLFRVGRGQAVTAGGSQQSVEMFSHLSNDTVITSAGKDFEISAGAQMQLLIGVNR